MTDIAIRRFVDADLDDVVALVNRAMGSSRRFVFDRAYWRWKHFDNPSGRSPCLVAVAVDGRIVGVRAFMRWTFLRGDRPVPALRAVDTAIHPDFQGQGLFTRLTKQLLCEVAGERAGFVFNTPNAKSLPGYVRMGWRELGRRTLWLKPLRRLDVAYAILRTRVAQGSSGNWDVGGPPIDHLLAGHLEGRFRDDTDEDDRLVTARTTEYLRWRYALNPSARYRAWLASSRRGSAAVVVRGGMRGGLREALLCDIFLGTNLGSIVAAISLIRRFCRESGAHYVAACAASDGRLAAVLAMAGFLPLSRCTPMLTVRDVEGSAAPRSLDELRASIGDLELF